MGFYIEFVTSDMKYDCFHNFEAFIQSNFQRISLIKLLSH